MKIARYEKVLLGKERSLSGFNGNRQDEFVI
jgi:hypothetical protein